MKTNDEALLKIKYNVLRTVSRLAFEGRLEEERDNIPNPSRGGKMSE